MHLLHAALFHEMLSQRWQTNEKLFEIKGEQTGMCRQPEAITQRDRVWNFCTSVEYMKIPEISLFVPLLLNSTDLYIPRLLLSLLVSYC